MVIEAEPLNWCIHHHESFSSLYLNVAVRMIYTLQNKNILSMVTSQIIPPNPFVFPISILAIAERMQKTIARGIVIKDQINL